MERPVIEISHQILPAEDEESLTPAPSRALHELQDLAPAISKAWRPGQSVAYPFSNDESAIYFAQTASRTATYEYRTASNRTALLVGESSLAAALPHIPEDTVLIVDKDPAFCFYMQQYIEALRFSPDIQTWTLEMAKRLGEDTEGGAAALEYAKQLKGLDYHRQVRQWQRAGLAHGLGNDENYSQARRLAHDKAIIVWEANIKSADDMRSLARALAEHEATVTMANLTNALSWPCTAEGKELPVALEDIPMTAHAPILITAATAFPREYSEELKGQGDPRRETYLIPATGPFFGLQNLLENGAARMTHNSKAVFVRQYEPLGSNTETP